MSTKYKFRNNDKFYFVTYTVIRWIDLFIRDEYRQVLLDSWKYCQQHKGLEIYAYCIMPSHVHMIIGSSKERMQDIMRDMKSFTSTTLRKVIHDNPLESRKDWIVYMMQGEGLRNSNNWDWQLWKQDNHPIELYDRRITWQKLNYIHFNPVAAGFVDKEEEWLYSSARNYIGRKGVFDVQLIE